MHVQHVLGGLGLVLGTLLAPACAVSVESSSPGEARPGDNDGPTVGTEEEIELTKTLHCHNYPNVVECMIACGKAGVGCSPNERHPFKNTSLGTLDSCRTALPAACSYRFPNGDKCAFFKLSIFPPMCVYPGG